jgi:4-alpha-glucanotransferase
MAPNSLQRKSIFKKRGAGVLLHITSLPSPYGIGDIGPSAREFVDFLQKGHQRYWQLLPLNPTEPGKGNSPYSALSSMAGNTLLISPDDLITEGLLDKNDIQEWSAAKTLDQVDYETVGRNKDFLFKQAFENFLRDTSHADHDSFRAFCEREAYWLRDFSMYSVIREAHQRSPWYEWPESLRLRDEVALKNINSEKEKDIRYVQWLQFIFDKQWKRLKEYCGERKILLLGDMPFYVSYDSADVWAHPEIFCLDEQGKMTGIAGVPPDYFNENGQLWGMPVFKWDVLKQTNYDWWIQRIKKNLGYFDLIRLDHFRAFAAYWEVPEGETTAVHGEWKPGPGESFFDCLEKEIGSLPLVAEDLGDIDEKVHKLRRTFRLPGMKVLHFAFSENMPSSDYIPHNYAHNYVVYTGTHDNNTTLGWFKNDLKAADRKRVKEYVSGPVSEKNVHLALIRLAYASVARVAIIPMQDLLCLGQSSRMNKPASAEGNWAWRLLPGQLTPALESQLQSWTSTYYR